MRFTMEQQNQSIGSIAKAMLKCFTPTHFDEGQIIWQLGEAPEWVKRVVQRSYPDQSISPDFSNALFNILIEIYIADNYEEAAEFVMQMEPEKDIERLTAWLHKSPDHLQYLTNVLATNPVADGVTLLSLAYRDYLREIGLRLIGAIEDYIQAGVEKSLSV